MVEKTHADNLTLLIENLQLSYKNFSINNISFSLVAGDILGLVGRSGSGKSTLIKAITGEKKPDKGNVTVTIDGNEISLKKMVGYSPQQNSLYPSLTLEENIYTFGRLMNLDKSMISDTMVSLLKRLDLQKSKEKKIIQLSGGMQKRADLAVTLIHDPRIIILDEPFTGLDISIQAFIWDFLLELSKRGKIVIVTSHHLEDIQKRCNKFALVSRGTFYNNEQITKLLNHEKTNLKDFLEKLFRQELILESE